VNHSDVNSTSPQVEPEVNSGAVSGEAACERSPLTTRHAESVERAAGSGTLGW
jgi:hypothetical protein